MFFFSFIFSNRTRPLLPRLSRGHLAGLRRDLRGPALRRAGAGRGGGPLRPEGRAIFGPIDPFFGNWKISGLEKKKNPNFWEREKKQTSPFMERNWMEKTWKKLFTVTEK